MKIEKLTPEQEALIPVYRDKYLKKFFAQTNKDIKVEEAKLWFKWLYKLCELDEPEVYIVSSPIEAQKLANKLAKTKNKHYSYSNYGNSCDLGWISFYTYFMEVCGVEYEDKETFTKYAEFSELGVYDSVQLEGHCIVIKLPEFIKLKGEVMHSADSSAVRFEDGTELYFWMGVNVPKKFIMEPNTITQNDIISEENAEVRRAYREILGGKRYYEIISNGKGLKLIDEDIDAQGYPMKLYETVVEDSIINKNVQFLEVTCPSTERVYNIYPPNQESKNVWDAKASTFGNKKLLYRHGDVGLKKIDSEPSKPLIET